MVTVTAPLYAQGTFQLTASATNLTYSIQWTSSLSLMDNTIQLVLCCWASLL